MIHAPINKSYAEIDALLDTRIGLISGLWPEHAKRIAASRDYFGRTTDDFSKIVLEFPQQDFEDTYAARTYGHIAGRSIWTPIAKHLQMHMAALQAQNVSNVDELRGELVVNLYPYRWPSEHQAALKEVLYDSLGFDRVTLINLAPEHVTPQYLSDFSKMVCYDFDTWLTHHSMALAKTPLPHVEAIHPLIVKKDNGIPLSTAVKETTEAMKSLIGVTIVPLDMFSFKPKA